MPFSGKNNSVYMRNNSVRMYVPGNELIFFFVVSRKISR